MTRDGCGQIDQTGASGRRQVVVCQQALEPEAVASMPSRKGRAPGSTSRAGRSMRRASDIEKALAIGKERAKQAIAFRSRQRAKRARALAAASRAARPTPATTILPSAARALGVPATAGVLIAEGDSWFDYPLQDVLKLLEDEHGFDVESVAHRGDRIEDMAFAGGQLEEFTRRLEKTLVGGTVPRAILLSGGGNDIAGPEFGVLLNHAASPVAGLNDEIVEGVVERRLKVAYVAIIAAITAICEKYLSHAVPIITHGYDHPVPDGRGFLGGAWFLPGPWLQPGFREKGFGDLATNTAIVEDLIDRFNDMVKSASAEFPHVRYLNLRGTLTNGPRYKTVWANELHPTQAGFSLIAAKFARLIAALP